MRTETEHMIATLRTLMRLLGLRNADVEKKLGLSISYLSRLFNGGLMLRFEHILDIGAAMGLKPQELLSFTYPDPGKPSPAALKVQQVLRNLGPRTAGDLPPLPAAPSSQPPLTEADVERIVSKTLRRMISEGVGAMG
jgi:transcriptional regulator with XRE-family HTH domain